MANRFLKLHELKLITFDSDGFYLVTDSNDGYVVLFRREILEPDSWDGVVYKDYYLGTARNTLKVFKSLDSVRTEVIEKLGAYDFTYSPNVADFS